MRIDVGGERGAAPKHALWKDADGKVVGTYLPGELMHQSDGRVFRLEIDRATGSLWRQRHPPVLAFYESSDCSGTPLFLPSEAPVFTEAFTLADSGMTAFYAPETGTPTEVRSVWDDVFFFCTPMTHTLTVGAPEVLDLSSYREPFSLAME
jgi:hypothetical protein